MNRHLKAFLIAPLLVPGLMMPFLLPALPRAPWIAGLALMSASIASYAGALLVGAPAYMALRSRGWTAFWIAPVVGFVVGEIVGIISIRTVAVLTVSGAPSDLSSLIAVATRITRFPSPSELGLGIYGMLVGVVLWLIARPDRP
jgi:hypothetical protein